MLKRSAGFWGITFGLGLLWDILFWEKEPGISFLIYVVLVIAAGLFLAWRQDERPARAALLLIIPALFFAAMVFFRAEPFTAMISILLALGSLGLMALSFLGGRWVRFNVAEWIVNWAWLGGSAATLGGVHLAQAGKNRAADPSPQKRSLWSSAAPVIRGVLIAIPVIAVFTALLSSADAVFSQQVEDLLKVFDLKRLPEYIARLTLIVAAGWLLAGVYLHALTKSRKEFALDPAKPVLSPFLGATEGVIVLVSVNLLFAFFVAVQFRYFFGGQANINLDGFTYSEYARRGFSELLLVAFFSLLLFLGLSAIVRRETRGRKLTFSGMGILLLTLVSVILVSGFQRLSLYEQAYGFTRLRTYTHVFMIWLGILLMAVVLLEALGRLRFFVLAATLAAFGFVGTLGIMNVDAFIASQNIRRAEVGEELDFHYLSTLSPDAIPLMVSRYNDGSLPVQANVQVGAALACQAHDLQTESGIPWQSFQWSRWQAERKLAALAPSLAKYGAYEERGELYVVMNGEAVECYGPVEDGEER